MNPDMPLFEHCSIQDAVYICSHANNACLSIDYHLHGQYEFAGHVINLPQDVVSFAQYLSAELDASLAPWRLRHPSLYIN